MTGVLIDTGPLVAIVSDRDAAHTICIEQSRTINRPMLTCWPVLTEAAWLLRNRPTSVRGLFGALKDGTLRIALLDETDVPAERERLRTIFTLDRRDFSVSLQSQLFRLRLHRAHAESNVLIQF